MNKMIFTEIRLWLVQLGIPAALAYLYLKSHPEVGDAIKRDIAKLKKSFVK